MKHKNSFRFILLVLIATHQSYAQDLPFKRTSVRTGLGVGYNDGKKESGIGILYSIGWQKSFGKKNRIRLNPNLMIGGFLPLGITDTRDQFYRITSIGVNLHYDLIKYKAVSIVITGGSFLNYSRGLLGAGGWPETNNNNSEYFRDLYFGGSISIGLRINPKNGKLAYEFRPFNIQVGNDDFILGYFMFGVDIKIKQYRSANKDQE